jgi:Xaa-Pro dipeptidase
MSIKRIILITGLLALILHVNDVTAQEARARYEMIKLIRKEKFDQILPCAMRDSNVDMWIHVMQEGNPDALELDLGGTASWTVHDTLGFFIFTDRGGDRIERAVLGGNGDRDLYDIFGDERDITEFVASRDPERIAVNYSNWQPSADGMSYSAYNRLVRFLGTKYADRLVSAETVITLFRDRRVQTEIRAFAKLSEMQRQLMEETYKRIVPGVTTAEDLGWWVQDQLLERGLTSYSPGPKAPGSRGSDVYERGQFLSWDLMLKYLNFGSDFKRNGYILREGETDVPDGIKHAWERGQQARRILKHTLKIGQTSGEALEIMIKALEDEDYVYTPSADFGSQYRDLVNALGDSGQSGFTLDFHAVGNTGNSEIAEGSSIAPFRSARAHIKIEPNHLFSFEFVINTWVPEQGGRMSINFEDNAIVTENGIEFLYPPNEEIIIIR